MPGTLVKDFQAKARRTNYSSCFGWLQARYQEAPCRICGKTKDSGFRPTKALRLRKLLRRKSQIPGTSTLHRSKVMPASDIFFASRNIICVQSDWQACTQSLCSDLR